MKRNEKLYENEEQERKEKTETANKSKRKTEKVKSDQCRERDQIIDNLIC